MASVFLRPLLLAKDNRMGTVVDFLDQYYDIPFSKRRRFER